MRKQSPKPGGRKPEALTGREIEVLTWVARGKTYSEIALILGITEDTVRSHTGHAGSKLKTANKTHSVAVAVTLGYVKL
jgi:DNA-binding CsgD family transcriptional regulator